MRIVVAGLILPSDHSNTPDLIVLSLVSPRSTTSSHTGNLDDSNSCPCCLCCILQNRSFGSPAPWMLSFALRGCRRSVGASPIARSVQFGTRQFRYSAGRGVLPCACGAYTRLCADQGFIFFFFFFFFFVFCFCFIFLSHCLPTCRVTRAWWPPTGSVVRPSGQDSSVHQALWHARCELR